MLVTNNLTKSYLQGNAAVEALTEVSLRIPSGASCAVLGPSGSGKSTLLGLCAGLDRPSSGEIFIDGKNLSQLSENELSIFRGENIGFIFQSFELIPTLTALENVMLPAELRSRARPREQALELLSYMGLENRLNHFPYQLSGGEQQRVAVARAHINRPKVLFGDEPTGNLDADSGALVIERLFHLKRDSKTTLVLATHNEDIAARCEYVLRLVGGRVHNFRESGGARSD